MEGSSIGCRDESAPARATAPDQRIADRLQALVASRRARAGELSTETQRVNASCVTTEGSRTSCHSPGDGPGTRSHFIAVIPHCTSRKRYPSSTSRNDVSLVSDGHGRRRRGVRLHALAREGRPLPPPTGIRTPSPSLAVAPAWQRPTCRRPIGHKVQSRGTTRADRTVRRAALRRALRLLGERVHGSRLRANRGCFYEQKMGRRTVRTRNLRLIKSMVRHPPKLRRHIVC
jgi:hypothetical protein